VQLSRLYSNRDDLFSPLVFNSGVHASTLNVIFAEVQKRAKEGDSHNLGKTTLIALLDFLLLKDITSSDHFLARHQGRFQVFVFYLEIALHSGGFVTVRRSVDDPLSICLKRTARSTEDARTIDADNWDHWNVPLTTARQALDAYLDLRAIAPWDYRTGVSYFLRTQADYSDYFQIQKFMQGKDRAWKPYLAALLGLDHEAVSDKYRLEDDISAALAEKETREKEVDLGNRDRGELATRIEILRDEVGEIDARLDEFDFHEVEVQINKKVVDDIEARIADVGQDIYDLEVDIAQLDRSISTGLKFDLKRIKEIFDESQVMFPDAVKRSYEDLLDFNKKLTRERNKALRDRMKELQARQDTLTDEHRRLNNERQRLLAIVQQADTFKKYKALQKDLSERRATLTFLENQLAKVDAVAEIERRLRELRARRDATTTSIERSLTRGSDIKLAVTRYFNRFVKQVLNIQGEFIVSQNTSDNIEFEIRTKDAAGLDTSQDKGNSYHRLLCALFDLAVLRALENEPFYHFVYHDGILEGLDNRVKLRLLELVRETIAEGKIQYMLSVIDTDLPRRIDDGVQIPFSPEEIVLTLHDRGDKGRLFKMPPF
jgi:uncharacterized protein YydD (DUF2326 family)